MKVIIAEKEELGVAIAKALDEKNQKRIEKSAIQVNDDYVVTWASGHILKLKEPNEIDKKYEKWNLKDLPIYFQNWEKEVVRKDLLNTIKKYVFKSSGVIHAGDPDDEGQYLIDEILEFLNYNGRVERILINDNSKNAILKQFKNIKDNKDFVKIGQAAYARQIADAVLGLSLTRYFTLKNDNNLLSIGRVQTPTLALVVNRDLEIKKHIKEKYYELFLKIKINNQDVFLKLSLKKDEIITKREDLINKIEKYDNKNISASVKKEIVYRAAPLPYNLMKLSQEANNKYNFSSEEVLNITQSLRDNHKAITYNRSDCQYLSEEHFKEAPKLIPIIAEKIGLSHLNFNFTEEKKSSCFNDSNITAHHGIIPTFEGDINKFTDKEKKIYNLIAIRYLIQFLEKIKIEKTEIIGKLDDDVFKKTLNKVLDLGFANIYHDDEELSEKETEENYSLKEGIYNIPIKGDSFEIKENETKSKKPYTEATLIADMGSIAKYVSDIEIKELLKKKDKDKKGLNGSIGTPATVPSIIATLFKRGYIKRVGKTIVSTELGQTFLSTLPEDLKSPKMTALWWVIQEDIKEGKRNYQELIDSVLENVKEILSLDIKKIEKISTNSNKNLDEIGICPCCKSKILEGKTNYFCSGYKNGCKFSIFKESYFLGTKKAISKADVKKLLDGKSILVKNLESKKGTKYNAYFKLKDGKIELDRFEDKKK